MFKKISVFLVFALMGAIIVGCGSGSDDLPEVLALVNGEEISKEDFEAEFEQYLLGLQQQGHDLDALKDDPQFKEFKPQVQQQILDQLISVELINQGAADQGVTKDSVQGELDEFMSMVIEGEFGGDKDEFEKVIEEQLDLSIDEYKELLVQDLVQEEYLEKNIDFDAISVSKEDMKEVYDQQVEMMEAQGMEEIPGFDEIAMVIEEQLMDEQVGLKVQDFIEDLRADSDVEVKVEF
ncbi:SurA N-terminal domain-containing protein [Proteinivorax hydrogeniformans]|uniref:SurA N-terminal domain-containing protein n=1 Tax=Proteinivorax hydrogeniformans TaxID=1826727 RepID=A0AAU8HR19_9FIRM